MWETSKLSHFVQLSVFLSSELETKSIVTAWYWTLYQWVKQREHLGMNQNMQENRNIFYIFKIWLIVFISKRKNRCSSSLGTKYLFRSSYFFTKVNQQCGCVAKAFWRKSANAFLCDFCDVSLVFVMFRFPRQSHQVKVEDHPQLSSFSWLPSMFLNVWFFQFFIAALSRLLALHGVLCASLFIRSLLFQLWSLVFCILGPTGFWHQIPIFKH